MPWMALLVLVATVGLVPAAGDEPADRLEPDFGPRSAATPSTAHSVVPEDPWSSPEIVAPRMDARPLPRRPQTAGLATGNASPPEARRSWVRTTVSLAGVLALIVLLAWGYRLMANNGGRLPFAFRGRHPSLIEVVGRTSLSPRQSLCLVRIGPRLVLLGVTPDAVRSLDVIDDADLVARLMGQVMQQRPDSNTAAFAQCLERQAQAYEDRSDGPDEQATPEESRIIGIKARLVDTIQRLRATAAEAS